MKKLKVLTVVGTRPEIIRLACVLNALDANEAIEHTLVHTGQNYDYELNEIFFEDFGVMLGVIVWMIFRGDLDCFAYSFGSFGGRFLDSFWKYFFGM